MSTRRIFIAVVPPENIINSLIKTIRSYKKESWGKDVKWVKPEHLHLTLKFIGQVESNKIAKISSAVKAATQGFGGGRLKYLNSGYSPNRYSQRLSVRESMKIHHY